MLLQPKTARQTMASAAEAAQAKKVPPAGTLRSDDYPWGRIRTEPIPAGNFIRGVLVALPLSISLWAGIIMGLRAVF
jgi:hypothetical protein